MMITTPTKIAAIVLLLNLVSGIIAVVTLTRVMSASGTYELTPTDLTASETLTGKLKASTKSGKILYAAIGLGVAGLGLMLMMGIWELIQFYKDREAFTVSFITMGLLGLYNLTNGIVSALGLWEIDSTGATYTIDDNDPVVSKLSRTTPTAKWIVATLVLGVTVFACFVATTVLFAMYSALQA